MRLKSDLYVKEQTAIENKLLNILNLDSDNTITLYDLDNDSLRQKKILELIPEIKRYYNFKNIAGVRNTNKITRPWLSIVRHLMKKKFSILSADCRININNEVIRTKKYIFLKIT